MRTPVAIVVDGRLDDAAWSSAPVTSGFLQVEPEQNSPARFRTEVRVVFDSVNIYVAMRALDQDARHELRSPELARDFNSGDTDFFGMALDPFADRRNALLFETSPFEAIQDIQAFDGRIEIEQWDAKWKVRTRRDAEGWTAEYSIPWTSIRYPSDGRAWGVNFYRRARKANELSAWAPWPRNVERFRMDYAGDIDGLEPPVAHTNIRARPYVLAQTERDDPSAPKLGNASVKAGGEVTWAPGPNSVLDVTVNTDFAQTDVDQQVVNLKRFSVFFPERRQFFLESANVFETGLLDNNFVFRPFFSRTIGLDSTGATVPIVGGARFVERSASEAVGALLVHQEGSDSQGPSTFAVGRYSRYLGDGSRIGALGAVRIDEGGPGDSPGRRSYVGALDGFTRLSPQTTLDGSISPFFDSNGKHGLGAHTYITRQTQSLLTSLYVVLVTKDYNPPTGFVSRTNVVVAATTVRGDLRPRWRPRIVRSFQPGITNYSYLTPSSLGLQEAVTTVNFNTVFQTGAQFNVYGIYQNERPTAAVDFLPTVTVPPGSFNFRRVGTSAVTDASAPFSAQLQVETGGFYDGTLTLIAPGFRYVPDPRISLAATYSVNQLHDVGGIGNRTTTHLLQPTLRLGLNPRTLLTAFYQYNSTTGTGSLNARFSWEFMPLSYLFLVYNDLRAAGALSPFTMPTKSLTAKLSYLLQW